MADKDELGGTLPSQLARKSSGPKDAPPGEDLPFEAAGRFVDAKELGRGGLGVVYLATDAHLQRAVALKQMLPDVVARGGSTADAIAERFLREARITAGLEHPGVVPVYELGKRNDGSLYYAMKVVQGRTLAHALEASVSLEERLSLVPHFLDVVQTVAFAHSHGVVHRDLKPENVMVGAFGETQVLDWGLARAQGQAEPPVKPITLGDRPSVMGQGEQRPEEKSGSRTVAGQAMGTPRYMSPEQAHGKVEQMDAQSDVWSLGVMLFEVLTGRTPFDGKTAAALMVEVVSAEVPKVEAFEPLAPAALTAVVRKALERDRAKRYASAVQMAEALSAALGVHVDVKKRPVEWIVLAAALCAIAAVFGGMWISARGTAGEVSAQAEARDLGAKVVLARALAERAQAAWDVGDVSAAAALATEAQTHANVPLANGVQALVKLSGAPRQLWSVVVPGGCTAVAARNGLVACATLGGVAVFDSNGTEQGMLKGSPSWEQAVAFGEGTTLVSSGDDRQVRTWNVETRAALGTFALPSDAVTLAAAPDGVTFYAGLRDGQVMRWTDGEAVAQVAKHEGAVRALAVGAPGLATSGRDGLRVFLPATAKEPAIRLDRPVQAMRWTPDGLVVALERDLFLVGTGGGVARWPGHSDDVRALASARHWPLVSGGADATVRGWVNGRPVARLSGFGSAVTALAGDPTWPGGPDLYVATKGRTLEAWTWPPDQRAPVLPELGLEPAGAAMAPDATVVIGFRDGKVMRLVGARNVLPIGGASHTEPVKAVAVAERAGLSGSDDGQVLTWGEDAKARAIDAQPSKVRAVAISADGLRAAWSYDDATFVLWSLEFNKEIVRQKDAVVNAIAFSADGTTVALGAQDKRVLLLEATTGKTVRTLEGHDGAVHAAVFSPDGKRLATGGADRRVTIWDAETGRPGAQLMGATDRIGALAFSRDGASIAAGADDGAVYLWSVASLALTSELRIHAGDVLALGFGADGRLLVVGSDRTARWLTVAQ